MQYHHVSYEKLNKFCVECFKGYGFNEEQAQQITDVLLAADLSGIESHGIQRLIRYHKEITSGMVQQQAQPEIVFETPLSAVIEGNDAMGQLLGVQAMQLAIDKAKKSGFGMVTVRNSNHYGIAGYYTKMACEAGMIGLSTTNSESIMVHTGSKKAVLGSNPIAFAVPADPIPFWFDAATTVVPRGKIEVYHKENKELDPGWAVDNTGATCTNPERVLECISNKSGGGILPVGGADELSGSHKGYGYSMICEILSAICSFGATSNHHVRAKGVGAGTCHSFIVIDPAIFGDPEEMKANMSQFLQELRDAARADEDTPIYTHGEKEHYAYQKNMEHGIDVNISTVAEMASICETLGMDQKEYLGDIDVSNVKKGFVS